MIRTLNNKYQKFIISGTIFSAICSVPADLDLFLHRTSSDLTHLIVPNNFSKPVINYLNEVKEKKGEVKPTETKKFKEICSPQATLKTS